MEIVCVYSVCECVYKLKALACSRELKGGGGQQLPPMPPVQQPDCDGDAEGGGVMVMRWWGGDGAEDGGVMVMRVVGGGKNGLDIGCDGDVDGER